MTSNYNSKIRAVSRNHVLLKTLLALPLLGGCTRIPEDVTLKEGDRLPSFSVMMDDGTVITDNELKEGFSIISFFHTLCPDCQEELPELQRVHEDCPDLKMVLISRNEGESEIRTYWKENNLTLSFSVQEDDRVFRLFAQHTIPRTYIVMDGVIIKAYDDNPVASYEEMERMIRSLGE